MKSNRFSNLLEKDWHLVDKRKIIFAIPLAILLLAVILMIVFNFTLGSALNLGTDFTGGYSVDVKLGNKLTDSNYQVYYDRIEDALSSVTAENGKTYNVTISGAMQRQGSGDDSSIHVRYAALRNTSENEMSRYVNPAIISTLERQILNDIPAVAVEGSTIKLTYENIINDVSTDKYDSPFKALEKKFNEIVGTLNSEHNANITVTDIALDPDDMSRLIITSSTAVSDSQALKTAIVDGMILPDIYAGSVTGGDLVGATVSTELLFNAVLAVSLALIFMLCYIGLRFQLSSGLACILALFHDIIIMFCGMAIFHIEINSTFIAALITILGYSINNSIILFDRVRENMRSVYAKNMTPEGIADKSIKETIMRSINTTITTLIMILMVAIIGVSDIRIFAFPIIIGLLAGTFSSIFIAPSLWALFQRVGKNRELFNLQPKEKKSKKKPSATEISA